MSTAQNDDKSEKKAPGPREQFALMIANVAKEYAAASPLSVPAADQKRAIDRVVLAIRAMAASKPDIYECTLQSIGRAVALSAITGLMPGGALPEVDLIPRQIRIKQGDQWVNKTDWPSKELNWQVGWRGYKVLAARSGCIAKAIAVYEGDVWEWEEGLESKLVHRPAREGRMVVDIDDLSNLVAAYVVATYPDGRKDFLVIDREQILKRRDSSDGWKSFQKKWIKSTPWADWADEMILKTAMRYAAGRGLLLMDDVARYAFDHDTEDDKPRREVIDTEVRTSAPAPTETRTLPDYGGLNDLEDDLLGREREPLHVHEPANAANGKGAEKPRGNGKGSKSKGDKGQPQLNLTAEHVSLIAEAKAGADVLGDELDRVARERAGIADERPEDLPLGKLREYVAAQKKVDSENPAHQG